jgi:hypothetical protein
MKKIIELTLAFAAFIHLTDVGAQTAVLRIMCSEQDVGAEVFINDKFKGECPFDTQVNPGEIRLFATQKAGQFKERSFEAKVKVAEDTVKKLEIHLGEPQLTAEGVRQEAEQRRLAAEAAALKKAERERKLAEFGQARVDYDDAVEKSESILKSQMAAFEKDTTKNPYCRLCPKPAAIGRALPAVLPKLESDKDNSILREIESEIYNFYNDPKTALFAPDKESVSICPSAEKIIQQLTRFGWVRDMNGKENDQNIREFTQSGNKKATYSRGAKYWPISLSCNGGVIDGPVDVWAHTQNVFYDIKTDGSELVHVIPKIHHVKFYANKDGPIDDIKITQIQGDDFRIKSRDGNAEYSKYPYFITITFATTSHEGRKSALEVLTFPSNFASRANFENKPLELASTTDLYRTSLIHEGTTEQTSYSKSKLTSLHRYKNGLLDGTSAYYTERYESSFFGGGSYIPTVELSCYSRGNKIADNACR